MDGFDSYLYVDEEWKLKMKNFLKVELSGIC